MEEVHYVELSDRADFNDRFVDRLAFPVSRVGGSPSSPAGRCPARRRRRARRGWPVDVHPLPPLLHNRPGADRRRGRGPGARAAAAVRGGWPWRTPTAGPTARSTTVCARLGRAPPARRRLLRAVRRRGPGARAARGRARHVRADRLPRGVVPPLGRRRARPGPPSRAARRLLPATTGASVWLAQHPTAALRAAARARRRRCWACRWRRSSSATRCWSGRWQELMGQAMATRLL